MTLKILSSTAFALIVFGCVWVITKWLFRDSEKANAPARKLSSDSIRERDHPAEPFDGEPSKKFGSRLYEESQRLVDEKPNGWEYLLFAYQIKRAAENLRKRRSFPAYGPGANRGSSIKDNRACIAFCRDKLEDVNGIIKAITNSGFDADLVEAKKTGNTDMLLRAAEKVSSGFRSLLDWESSVRSVQVAADHRKAIALLLEMGEPAIQRLEDFCLLLHGNVSDHIDRVKRGDNPGYIEFECDITLGDDARLTEECKRLADAVEPSGSAAVITEYRSPKNEEVIEDPTDPGYFGDVYNYWIPLEDYSRKVSAHLHVKYMKNRGQIVERDFDLQSFRRGPEGYQLHGFCRLRGRPRTLVSMGFVECFDRDTGEVIPDIKAYIEKIYGATPTGQFDAIFDTHGLEVNILHYLAKADGAMRSGERCIIAAYIAEKLGDNAPSLGVIESELKKMYALSVSQFRAATKELAGKKAESLDELIGMWENQISKKKIAHTEETRALNYMKRALKEQK